MTKMQVAESKSHSVVNAYLSLTAVNDKYASTECILDSMFTAYLSLTIVNDKNASRPFLICTRLGVVNDKYAGYCV